MEMKPNLKKWIIIMGCIIGIETIALFAIIPIYKTMNYFENWYDNRTRYSYSENFDLTIPADFEYVYYENTDPNVFGEGYFYRVYEYNEGISGFYADFQDKPDARIEKAANYILDELNIPEEERPDFSRKYKWKKMEGTKEDLDQLYIFFDEEQERFYFVEDAF